MTRTKYANGIEYKVESQVPMPRKVMDRCRFPFDKMKIGDSFFIPKKDQDPTKARISIYAASNSFNKNHKTDYKMSSRIVEGGLRVWRIK
jgi:hypothetical protein